MKEMNMNGVRSKGPQHIEDAKQIASELMDRFSLHEQNEVLSLVLDLILETRQKRVDHLETRQKRVDHLQCELEELKASINHFTKNLSV